MPATPSNNALLLVTGVASEPAINDLLSRLPSRGARRGFGKLAAPASPETD